MQSQATQSKPQQNKNKAALDEEIEAQMKQLQSNMYSLKGHVDSGNVEVAQQEETLTKVEKNITKIENNNIKANWITDSGKSTWGMIKSLFTGPKLKKDPEEVKEDPKKEAKPAQSSVTEESGDRLDDILRVTGEVRTGVKEQGEGIIRTTKKIESIQEREYGIIKEQGKIQVKVAKWAK